MFVYSMEHPKYITDLWSIITIVTPHALFNILNYNKKTKKNPPPPYIQKDISNIHEIAVKTYLFKRKALSHAAI